MVFNLSFCSDVAYAVPGNPKAIPAAADLAAIYDNNANASYQNFSLSLQQISCNTTSTSQYSLVRTCDDCARAYKNWLCAVSIPRCADYSANATFLQARNVGQSFVNGSFLGSDVIKNSSFTDRVFLNSSRNPIIDTQIKPGPYKEVLPCDDLCYSLIQSCPASLGFDCPRPGRGLERSYGKRSTDGSITCSYLGAYELISAAVERTVPFGLAVAVAIGVTLLAPTM